MPTATAPAPAPAAAAKPSKPKKPKTPKPASAAPASEQPAAAKKPPAKDAKPKAEPKDPNKAAIADAKNPKGEAKGPGKTQAANNTAPAKAAANKDHVKSNGTNKDVKQADQKIPEAATNGKAASPLPLPKTPVSVPVCNALDVEVCARLFENLLDFSPSIGFALANLRPFKSAQHILDQLNGILESLPTTYLHSFLKRCNELGLIAKTKLTKEQKLCAGLDKLSDSTREELAALYSEYREKFGFPFVVFARDVKASDLAAMIRTHLLNNEEQEMLSGLGELKKIANFRLRDLVSA